MGLVNIYKIEDINIDLHILLDWGWENIALQNCGAIFVLFSVNKNTWEGWFQN